MSDIVKFRRFELSSTCTCKASTLNDRVEFLLFDHPPRPISADGAAEDYLSPEEFAALDKAREQFAADLAEAGITYEDEPSTYWVEASEDDDQSPEFAHLPPQAAFPRPAYDGEDASPDPNHEGIDRNRLSPTHEQRVCKPNSEAYLLGLLA
jgi:hypothetical protein